MCLSTVLAAALRYGLASTCCSGASDRPQHLPLVRPGVRLDVLRQRAPRFRRRTRDAAGASDADDTQSVT